MKNFKPREDRSGGFRGGNGGGKPSFKPSFQKKSWSNDRGGDRGETVMHKATCSHCGKACEVPFRPTGEKPVYCRDCFNRNRDGEDARPARSFDKGSNFKKSFSKSYEGSSPRPEFARADIKAAPADDTKQKLADISFKLDVLIRTIEKMTESRTAPAETIAPEKVKIEKAPVKAPAKAVKKVAKKK
jgi:CxxC-x17-CxxC domain-containing protein